MVERHENLVAVNVQRQIGKRGVLSELDTNSKFAPCVNADIVKP